MSRSEKPSLFISYTWEDKPTIGRLVDELKNYEVDVWYDSSNTCAGDNLPARISEGLEKSNILLLFWSRTAAKSRWVELEWCNAVVLQHRIIPCLLDATFLPAILRSLLYIDFRDFPSAFETLCKSIPARRCVPYKPLTAKDALATAQGQKNSPPIEGLLPKQLIEQFSTVDAPTNAELLLNGVRRTVRELNRGSTAGTSMIGSGDSFTLTPEAHKIREVADQKMLADILSVLVIKMHEARNYDEMCESGLSMLGILKGRLPEEGFIDRPANVDFLRYFGVTESMPFDEVVKNLGGIDFACWW